MLSPYLWGERATPSLGLHNSERVASIHRAAERRSSRKLGFRLWSFLGN